MTYNLIRQLLYRFLQMVWCQFCIMFSCDFRIAVSKQFLNSSQIYTFHNQVRSKSLSGALQRIFTFDAVLFEILSEFVADSVRVIVK